MHHGSCLCGGVAYEIAGELGPIVHCHCSMCRRAQGAAFRTRAAVKRAAFRFVRGEELLTRHRSSADTVRTFCRVCGSPLISLWDGDPDAYGLALGTLETDPGARPLAHVFVASKAPWFEIEGDLPQFPALPPRR
jgi:hypothetical protein